MCELGWKSLGVQEITALPSIGKERWIPRVREADVLLANGGDALYLCHWMRQSGLADLLPSLHDTVWVGLSAGSMVMTPRIGEDFVGWKPPGGGDSTLGLVDFSIFPHLDHEALPENSMADAERWATGLANPAYAIDDQTAITVTDGEVEVVSEGTRTAPAKARLTDEMPRDPTTTMPVGPNFSFRISSLIGSPFRPTDKRNNGHRRRSQAAACHIVRTKVKEK
jgi:hypothetical protein